MRFIFAILFLGLVACKSGQTKAEPVGQTEAGAPAKSVTAPTKNAEQKKAEPLTNPYESLAFMTHSEGEHKKYGTANRAQSYKKKKYGNSVVEQRSGRKRLYDHNIFLRALLNGNVASDTYGNLKDQFDGGIFLDIGSAILFGEGADTVRDLYEDKAVSSRLTVIASDINDASSKQTRYVEIYRAKPDQLPFPVVEIPMMMDNPESFTGPLNLFLQSNSNGVILRSANAGPDLYYDMKQVQKHLQAALIAFYDRPLIYLFNKYILYKPRKRTNFLIIGEIDEEVGTNHRKTPWEKIDWTKRTFEEAVRLNTQHMEYRP